VSEENRKADLVGEIVKSACRKVGAESCEEMERFVEKYFALVAPDDVVYTDPETLVGSVMSLWDLGAKRELGVPEIRIYNPTKQTDGWGLEHTVIEIVNDDMPFLVDSVTMELNRLGRNIHLLIHPVIDVERRVSGERITDLHTRGEGSVIPESLMHCEIDQETDAAELDEIRANLLRVLADVRQAVVDWRPMQEKLREVLAEIDTMQLEMPADDVDEIKSFLRWLEDEDFVFVGYRRYHFEHRDARDYLVVEPETGLGILRDVRPESVERGRRPFDETFSRFAHRKDLLLVAKANTRSTIHRPVHMDRISVKRYDSEGHLIGEHRFLGLFTSRAYSRSVKVIPLLRHRVAKTIERAGIGPRSHAGKALAQILETFPRDELFQVTDDELFEISLGILQLQERQRIALFARRDVFDRFVSCLVYIPRDHYDSELREKVRAILEVAFNGSVTAFYTQITDSPLARVQFIVGTKPGEIPDVDIKRIEAMIAEAARDWSDHLRDALVRAKGEEAGLEIWARYRGAFPSAYRERFNAAAAIADIDRIERTLATGELDIDLYQQMSEEEGGQLELRCKFIHKGSPLSLSDVVPRLENKGLRVEMAVPYELRVPDADEPIRVRDFQLVGPQENFVLEAVKPKFEEAFRRAWKGDMEDDGFNRLVIRAGLDWEDIVVLRAYTKFLRQTGITFSEAYMQQTLANHAEIAKQLVRLFHVSFDPSLGAPERELAEEIRGEIRKLFEHVTNADEDRIVRRYLNVVDSTLRTNFFQRDANGSRKSWLSFKFDSTRLKELPAPRPMFEIFVYSPRFEGVHLRGGKVARGGLRWSDRREDFRTEILGLMKAQLVKNAVIVPVGSKGGFVLKQAPLPSHREEFLAEGVTCYKNFLRGLLDLTDNLVDGNVVPPPDVVRRDEDDTYLVVAADKGTATFSDFANSISAEYGFWLGDAFASGGSVGYDHKKMGITARGAWEAVKRHFREIGIDIQREDFTAVGVGDMSGDVFGNGMLLSEKTKLIGAFNHLHIFVDPDPDPATSFAERKRLFDLPRSSWTDYDPAALSKGGAVFERSAKSVTLSPEAQARLDLPSATLTPNELIRAILKARADLLWLGGIGTYVKSSDESNAHAHDRANDALRVNADELRVRVVGEGANLGLTQRARIEFALEAAHRDDGGGRLNTDAIDNSAGVDTSDHEVNIKILLDETVRRGQLAPGDRDSLLAEMTNDVAQLVLRDNYQQTQAISVAEAQGVALLDEQARFIRGLERAGKLDRALEALPDDETIAERASAGVGLTRPELCVLLAYSKINVYQEVLGSDLPDDPLLIEDLVLYFPPQLRDRFQDLITKHRLRREIIATYVTNSMVNRVGPTFVYHMNDQTGRSTSDIARAYAIVRESFQMRATWKEIEALDNQVPAELQSRMFIEAGRLIERATRWFLRTWNEPLEMSTCESRFRPAIAELEDELESILPATLRDTIVARREAKGATGLSAALARRMTSLEVMGSFPDIVLIAKELDEGVLEVGRVYFQLGARFEFDRLRMAASSIHADTPWLRAAVDGVVDDLFAMQSELVSHVLSAGKGVAIDAVDLWLGERDDAVRRTDQLLSDLHSASSVDLAMISVAARELRALVAS